VFYLKVKTKLIGAGVRDSCLEKHVQGRPRRRKPRRLPDRPRKASLTFQSTSNCTSYKKM